MDHRFVGIAELADVPRVAVAVEGVPVCVVEYVAGPVRNGEAAAAVRPLA